MNRACSRRHSGKPSAKSGSKVALSIVTVAWHWLWTFCEGKKGSNRTEGGMQSDSKGSTAARFIGHNEELT